MFEEAIRQRIAEVARVSPRTLRPDTHLMQDLGMSSLELLQVLAFAEQRFGITIPNDELVDLTTVGRIIAKIRTLCSDSEPAAAAL